MKAFYNSMKNYSGGDLTGYIVGAYTTNNSATAAKLKSVSSSGVIQSTTTTLDFEGETTKKYVLVEVWTPTGYSLDNGYYAFYLTANYNMEDDYTTAAQSTSLVCDTGNSSYDPVHYESGSSTNTWDEYASLTGNDSTTAALKLSVTDKKATYYGTLNIRKHSEANSSTYVGGAVYALIKTGAGVDYSTYTDLAAQAYAAYPDDSTKAMKKFYSLMAAEYDENDTSTLASYIVGGYTTNSDGTSSRLKALNSDGSLSSTDKVINFGSSDEKRFVLVEVWTPEEYSLDGKYYAFYLKTGQNESSDYTTAARASTIDTDKSLLHKETDGENTWEDDTSITNNEEGSTLCLEIEDSPASYYAALTLTKVSSGDSSKYIGGAVYALMEKDDNMDYDDYLAAAKYANENSSSRTEAILTFYDQIMWTYGAVTSAGTTRIYLTKSDGTAATCHYYDYYFALYGSDRYLTNFYSNNYPFELGSTTTSAEYVLVEIYTPDDYNLDDDYYAFTLHSNNMVKSWSTAAQKTTVEWIHQGDSVTVEGGSSTATTLKFTFKDSQVNYKASLSMRKVDDTSSSTYVGGAVYALVPKVDDLDYEEYLEMAQDAYENATTSDEAVTNFYTYVMEATYGAGLGYNLAMLIPGTFTTNDDGSSSYLEYHYAVNVLNGTVQNDMGSGYKAYLQFGTDASVEYVLVELWTPEDYMLADDYYSFYLDSNGNQSSSIDTILKASGITWTHEGDASIKGGSSSGSELLITCTDTKKSEFYAAFNLLKVDADDSSEYVGGAVYALLEKSDDAEYEDYAAIAKSACADSADGDEAKLNFIKKMGDESIAGDIECFFTTNDRRITAVPERYVFSYAVYQDTLEPAENDDYTIYLGYDDSKEYVLVEIWSPDGYVLDNDYYAFKLNSQNSTNNYNIALYGTTITEVSMDANSTIDGNTTSNTLCVTMSDPQGSYGGKFSIQKVDDKGNVLKKSGIIFTVYDESGNVVDTITTDASGVASYTFGTDTDDDVTYYVQETTLPSSLAGYELNTDYFRVVVTPGATTSDASIDVYSGSAMTKAATSTSVTVDDDLIRFELPNKHKTFYGQFSIQKVDQGGNELEVQGIKFYVYSDEDCTQLVTTITTNADGIATYVIPSWEANDKGTNKTKTYYVKEDPDSVSVLDYMTANDDIYTIKVTASSVSADKCTIKVTSTKGETVVVSGNTADFPNDVTTTYTVEKEFVDGSVAGDRIQWVQVTLYRSSATEAKTKIDTVTLSESANNWTYTWEDLEAYDDYKNAYDYTATETKVKYIDQNNKSRTVSDSTAIKTLFAPVYTENSDGTEMVIQNNFFTTTHTVNKTNAAGVTSDYVQSVKVSLLADGTTYKTATLSSANTWTYTWSGLDKYDYNGSEIEYTVEETEIVMTDPDDTSTTASITGSLIDTEFDIVLKNPSATVSNITNTLNTVDLDVEKTFGTDTKDRIEWVEVTLYKNGSSTGETLTLDSSNNWSGTFEDLIQYKVSGEENTYKAVETAVRYKDVFGDYHTVTSRTIIKKIFTVKETTSDEKTTIKNTINTTEFTINKYLPTEVSEQIVQYVAVTFAGNNRTIASVSLNSSNNWTYSWDGLDIYSYTGSKISYTGAEVMIMVSDQFPVISTATHAVSDSTIMNKIFAIDIVTEDGVCDITNTVNTIDIPVTKILADEDTKDRVSEVEVTLLRNGVSTGETLTLNETNNWTDTFEELVQYDYTGTEYEYTVEETAVTYTDMWGDEYTITDRDVMEKLFNVVEETVDNVATITNTFSFTEHSVEKTFTPEESGNELTKQLVMSVESELLADGASLKAIFGNKTLDDTNDWTDTWELLDEYDHLGNKVTYEAKEVGVDLADQFDASVVTTVSELNAKTVFTIKVTTSDGKTTINNKINTINLDVEKVFGEHTEERVKEVVVTLYRNDEAMPYTLTLDASNNWSDTFIELVQYDPYGNEYDYRAVETSVTYVDMWGDEYTVTDRDVMDKLFNVVEETDNYKTTITNTFSFTERNVFKLFATKLTETRLVQITARIYADGRDASSLFGDRILNADNGWLEIWDGYNSKNVWVGLDKYDHNGNEITYTTTEIQAIYTDKDSPEETQHIVSGGTLITIADACACLDKGIYCSTNIIAVGILLCYVHCAIVVGCFIFYSKVQSVCY